MLLFSAPQPKYLLGFSGRFSCVDDGKGQVNCLPVNSKKVSTFELTEGSVARFSCLQANKIKGGVYATKFTNDTTSEQFLITNLIVFF